MSTNNCESITPGKYSRHEFLTPLGITQIKLANDIGVPISRINDIIHGLRRITIDTVLRLAIYLNTSDQMWINLQVQYDLKIAKKDLHLKLQKEVHPLKKAS